MASGVEAGVAYISVAASTKEFAKNVKSALGEFDQEVAKSTTGRNGFGSKLASGFAKAGKAGLAFGGIITGLAVKGGISRSLAIEDARAKMQGLKLDTETMDKAMENALNSVRGTAFGLGDAAGLASTMIAAGIRPGEDLERTLRRVADSATVAGTDLNDMGLIWGKAAAKGRIDGQLMNQMLERQIPIYDILSQKMGVTADEVQSLVSKGKVDFQTFSDAMDDYVGGAALRSGETTRGAWANMLAAFSRVGEQLISGIFPKVRGFFQGVMEWADKVAPYAAAVGEAIGDGIATAVDWISKNVLPVLRDVGQWIVDNLVPAFQALGDWLWNTGIPALKSFAEWIKDNIFPYLRDIANVVTERVIPAIQDFVQGMRDGEGAGGFLVTAIKNIYEALKTAVTWLVQNRTLVWSLVGAYAAWKVALLGIKFGKFIVGIGKSITAIGKKAVALAKSTIAGAKWMAWQVKWVAWNTKNFIVAMAKWIASVAKSTALWLKNTAAIIANRTAQVATTAATKAATAAQKLFNLAMNANPIMKVVTALTVIVGALTYFFTQTEIGRKIWQGFIDFLSAAWEWIRDLAINIWQGIADFFTGLWDGTKSTVETVWNGISDFFTGLWSSITGAITSTWNAISDFFSTTWNGIKSVAETVWNAIKTTIETVINTISTIIGTVVGGIKTAWDTSWNAIKTVAETVWGAIKTAVNGVMDFIEDWIVPVIEGIASTWDTIWTGVQTVIETVWDAISTVVTTTIEVLTGAIEGFKKTLDSVLGSGSMWQDGRNAGNAIGDGLVSGMNARTSDVASAADRLAKAARDRLPNSPAKKGPFSGAGWGGWGEAISDQLADGLDAGRRKALHSMQATMSGLHGEIDGADVRFRHSMTAALDDSPQPDASGPVITKDQLDYLIDGLQAIARAAGMSSNVIDNARRRVRMGV